MWSTLPDGALKRQLLGDLAEVARLDVSELGSLWSARGDRPRERPPATSPPVRTASTRRPRQGAANLLDRALWLILRQPELWWSLDDGARNLLVEQTPPYAALIQALERSLHEQGAIASTALTEELRKGASDDLIAAAALERIAAFHDPEPGTQLQQQLALVIDHLRLREVDEELRLLFQSGIASPDAQQRSASLVRHRAQLKAAIAGATSLAN
jgi:DNA primase